MDLAGNLADRPASWRASSSACTTLKIAVLAPIPKARVRMAASTKPGLATPPQPESDHLENLAEVLKDIEAVEAAKGIPDTGTEVPAPL